jgi:UDP-N-acetylmuramoyl-L-alanyl-D-glutamate--2,6-diaminopimelate ligase
MARWFRDRDPLRGIPSVGLRDLLPEGRFVGCHDLFVSGCARDSRRIEPGEVFVAIPGARHDGHDFAARAIERGASGVIVERELPLDGAVQVILPDSRAAHARLVRALAGDPASGLRTLVVSGGRARPAAAAFLRSILEADGERVGMVAADGGWTDGTRSYPATGRLPAPEALVVIAETLASRGCGTLIVEAPPHLAGAAKLACLGPVEALVVPDVTPSEDLDERIGRRRALKRLARQVRPGGIVAVSTDDPESELLGAVNLEATRLGFGRDARADVVGELFLGSLRTATHLHSAALGRPVRLRPLGAKNARGAFAALTLAGALGIECARIVAGLEALAVVPGRLEPVHTAGPFAVIREDAECEATLRGGFAELRALGSRRIISVVAAECAGLERSCGSLSDLIIPGDDRRVAVELGLSRATAGDVVLLVGRPKRALGRREGALRIVDDRAIVAEWLKRGATAARRSA